MNMILEHLREFNRSYLADRQDRRNTIWTVVLFAIVVAGLVVVMRGL